MRLPTRSRLLVARWTLRSVRAARRQLAAHADPAAVVLPRPPHVRGGYGVVTRGCRMLRARCLVSALVEQTYLGSQGTVVDVVIGVARSKEAFAAHAWLASPGSGGVLGEFTEIRRLCGTSS